MGSHVQRSYDIELKTINITENNPFIIIYGREQEQSAPIWIIIVSIILGILLLVLLMYGAYKCGFFKRPMKSALSNENDDKQLVNPHELNSDGNSEEL